MLIVFYRNSRGRLPALDWLRELREADLRRYVQVAAALEELAECGRGLAQPFCEHLGDGLYLLRHRALRPCPPLLFFFHGEAAVALGPLTSAADPVPMRTLVRANRQRREFERDPLGRSHEEYVDPEEL